MNHLKKLVRGLEPPANEIVEITIPTGLPSMASLLAEGASSKKAEGTVKLEDLQMKEPEQLTAAQSVPAAAETPVPEPTAAPEREKNINSQELAYVRYTQTVISKERSRLNELKAELAQLQAMVNEVEESVDNHLTSQNLYVIYLFGLYGYSPDDWTLLGTGEFVKKD